MDSVKDILVDWLNTFDEKVNIETFEDLASSEDFLHVTEKLLDMELNY